LRRNPLTGHWVAVAPVRAQRPGAHSGEIDPPSADELASCPFCEGREASTPPETFAIAPGDRQPDTPGWLVRVVPNKYPALGRQEVVVHTPRHLRSLADLEDADLERVAQAWRARAESARSEGFMYVQALVNEGRDAGASLGHSHSQLVWLREEPPVPAAERTRLADECALCRLLEEERAEGARIVAERDGLVLLCPYAGRLAYELLIAPLEHEDDAFASERLAPALRLLAEGLRRLFAVEGLRPLNAWLHTAPFGERGHWHIEVLPRLSLLAGLELGAGCYVNAVPPEEAAEALRKASPARVPAPPALPS
jgi:UDPglucose--hexose-1-phosphate uridylyltransferase